MLGTARDTNIAKQVNRLQSDISDLTSQIGAFVSKERDQAGGAANKFLSEVNSRVSDYGSQLSDIADRANDQMDGLQRFMTTEVKRHPLRTLAIVGVAGLILGAMTRGK